MRFCSAFFIFAVLVAASGSAADLNPAKLPPLDKSKLERYLRYAEGFSPTVKFVIDDPAPTPLTGYYRLLVHLSMGEAKQEKIYYLTADGKHVLGGPLWDLNDNPFLETLGKLPVGGPSFGPSDAKFTLIVFSDFQCPYCREFARTLRDNLPQKYPKEVRVVFKDFPIDSLHPWARAAAEAGHCVGDGNQAAFWAFHDWIFQHQGEISSNNLREKVLGFAKEQSLDPSKVASCMDSHATKGEVEQNVQEGRELGIQQTPTFYLDGRTVPGAVPWTALNSLIEMEVNRPTSIPDAPPGK
ncbi:MAG: DsbA family protein [Acidobacteriota bacterium]|nr:DsbA family protein [Acidobacteriota bacterium]